MVAAGAVDEVRAAQAAGASDTARKALGFEELLAGDIEGMQRRTRNFAKRQLTWMRKLAGRRDPRHQRRATPARSPPRSSRRPPRRRVCAMRFEKWQALGNDYLIVERDQLPVRAHARCVVRRLCDPHLGVGADGVLELSPPDEAGFVARLRIFNPDGSEAELSGNGAREAILYLHRRGLDRRAAQFSIQTKAGEIRPTITSPTTCTVDMGRARTASEHVPDGAPDGRGTVEAGGRTWAFQHVTIGNPQCAHRDRASVDELNDLHLEDFGPAIEHDPQFPNRTNVSWWTETEPGFIRARIFERGVGVTMSSGTGACGAAVAYVLRGGDSPVRVALDGGELEVDRRGGPARGPQRLGGARLRRRGERRAAADAPRPRTLTAGLWHAPTGGAPLGVSPRRGRLPAANLGARPEERTRRDVHHERDRSRRTFVLGAADGGARRRVRRAAP